ncbi:MAG: Flp pilus assembly complex ATPase component TadA [Cryobacterium sp.]|nr:Flp pilus assembly complex ATPase component TadA [Cryobacterium sp.]
MPREPEQSRILPEFGELAPLVADQSVTDLFVKPPGEVWTDQGGGVELRSEFRLGEVRARQLATALISLGGRHIDEASPCVDVRLRDGIRVHAVLPPISPHGTQISIRLPGARRLGVADLDRLGFFERFSLVGILKLVRLRRNLLITGATGSGKTTLLSALLSEASGTDRIIAIEDVSELRVTHPHFLSLEARQANLEGIGEIGLARLVREALRMRPDRLVLGECRGVEVRELFAALNTGHKGGACTLHANSLEDVPVRLEALGALAGLGVDAVARQAVSAIDAILHVGWTGPYRGLVSIGRFVIDRAGRLETVPLGKHDLVED